MTKQERRVYNRDYYAAHQTEMIEASKNRHVDKKASKDKQIAGLLRTNIELREKNKRLREQHAEDRRNIQNLGERVDYLESLDL